MEEPAIYGGGSVPNARLLAVGREERNVTRTLTLDEKTAIRERLSDIAIRLQTRTEEIKLVAKEHREELDEIKSDLNELVSQLRHGSKTLHHDCYMVPDHEHAMMQFVDIETGEIVDERRLFPEERQQSLFNTVKQERP